MKEERERGGGEEGRRKRGREEEEMKEGGREGERRRRGEEGRRRGRQGQRECHSLVIINGIIFDLGGIRKVVQYSVQHYLRRGEEPEASTDSLLTQTKI